MLMKGFSGKMRTEHASAELPAVLIGWFCGFPAGASAAAELYKNGVCSAKEAERIAAVSSAASPVFVISFVGQTLFGSTRAGIAIEAAQLSASLITSLIFGKLLPKDNDFALPKSRKNGGNSPVFPGIADTVVYGITDAARASVSLCGFLVFFGTVSAHIGKLCLSLGISPVVSALLSGVFEITSGCSSAVEACGDTVFSPLLVGFSVGFSGLSVIFQSLSLLRENGIGCRAFFLSRLLSGFLCSLFCTAAYCLFSALRFM